VTTRQPKSSRRRFLPGSISLNHIHRALPARWFFVLHAYRYKLLVEPESRYVGQMVEPDETVVDVGACWGSYSYLFSKVARRVITLEPNPALVDYLRRVAPANVEVRNVAASDSPGHATLRVPIEGRDPFALASLEARDDVPGPSEDAFRMVEVETVRLDDLGLEHVGLVKIDVEGHEEAVLEGARDLISRQHPDLLIELEERHRPGVVARVGALLADAGYEGCFYLDKRWVPFEEFSVERHQNLDAHALLDPDYINLFYFSARGKHRRLIESRRR